MAIETPTLYSAIYSKELGDWVEAEIRTTRIPGFGDAVFGYWDPDHYSGRLFLSHDIAMAVPEDP